MLIAYTCAGCSDQFEYEYRGKGRKRTMCDDCYRLYNIAATGRRQKAARAAAIESKVCVDCGGEPGMTPTGRPGKRCPQCAKLKASNASQNKPPKPPKPPVCYRFACRRCGAVEEAIAGRRRRQFCLSCRGSSGGRLLGKIFCADCGCKMVSARTKRCPTCANLRERVRMQLRHRAPVQGLQRDIRRSLTNVSGWDFLKGKVGYSVADLRTHLERQFSRGMSWDAFRRGEIHIDHIVPLRTFDLTNEVEVAAAFALSNLRPMWAADNLKKGGKITAML